MLRRRVVDTGHTGGSGHNLLKQFTGARGVSLEQRRYGQAIERARMGRLHSQDSLKRRSSSNGVLRGDLTLSFGERRVLRRRGVRGFMTGVLSVGVLGRLPASWSKGDGLQAFSFGG